MNIKKELSKLGIKSIYHFTDESNLESIGRYGIQSLCNINKKSIGVSHFGADSSSHNLDKNKGLDRYVHLSFVQDHPMYHIAKKRGSIIKPVWIELDLSIIFENSTLFCDEVANKTGARIFKINQILQYINLKNLFNYADFWSGMESRKAEIMAYEEINIDKIKGVAYGK